MLSSEFEMKELRKAKRIVGMYQKANFFCLSKAI